MPEVTHLYDCTSAHLCSMGSNRRRKGGKKKPKKFPCPNGLLGQFRLGPASDSDLFGLGPLAEKHESDSDLEIAVTTTKKKKPLGARNTAPAPASPGGKHSAGKRRKEARTKENASDPYDDAVLDEPAAKAART